MNGKIRANREIDTGMTVLAPPVETAEAPAEAAAAAEASAEAAAEAAAEEAAAAEAPAATASSWEKLLTFLNLN